MPSLTLSVSPLGPLIEVVIFPSAPRQAALTQNGQQLPQPQKGTFLIDTGASGTCIDPGVLQPLGIPATGSTQVHTPSTNGAPHVCSMYDVMLLIPNGAAKPPYILEAIPVMETGLRSQGIDGLLGRDVLAHCTLVFNGADGFYTLCY